MKGSHGTCVSYAERIIQNGFKLSSSGKRGPGVYFWGYHTQQLKSYARELAEAWWNFAHTSGQYNSAADKNCAVLYVELQLDGGMLLDLEQHDIKHDFIKFGNDVYRRLVKLGHADKVSSACDMYVGMMEKESKKHVDIIHAALNAPRGFKGSIHFDLTGLPSCYVVRKLSCIKSTEYEK